jgi:glycosyltransferase involved in cell wall biosynthesis
MRRVVLPAVHRKALETLTHTALSTLHALRDRPDAAIVFNAANAPFVAILRAAKIPTALHIDGHDARREKWRGPGQRYYSAATRGGAVVATRVVVDSQAIAEELHLAHRMDTTFIPYGVNQPETDIDTTDTTLAAVGLQRGEFHLVVARFEPENKVLDILRGYVASAAAKPLVIVGFEGYPGDYARRITDLAREDNRVRLSGPIWDQSLLDALYAGAASYLHGHSVGGTNPSLLRAMSQRAPTIAFDCPYNRETTGGAAMWFRNEVDICALVELAEADAGRFAPLVAQAWERTMKHYTWAEVVSDYENLLADMTLGGAPIGGVRHNGAVVRGITRADISPGARRQPPGERDDEVSGYSFRHRG